jgi:hypothetical protein
MSKITLQSLLTQYPILCGVVDFLDKESYRMLREAIPQLRWTLDLKLAGVMTTAPLILSGMSPSDILFQCIVDGYPRTFERVLLGEKSNPHDAEYIINALSEENQYGVMDININVIIHGMDLIGIRMCTPVTMRVFLMCDMNGVNRQKLIQCADIIVSYLQNLAKDQQSWFTIVRWLEMSHPSWDSVISVNKVFTDCRGWVDDIFLLYGGPRWFPRLMDRIGGDRWGDED